MNSMNLEEIRQEATFGKRAAFNKRLRTFLWKLRYCQLPQLPKSVRKIVRRMIEAMVEGKDLTPFYGWRQFKLQAKADVLPVLSLFVEYVWQHPQRSVEASIDRMLAQLQ